MSLGQLKGEFYDDTGTRQDDYSDKKHIYATNIAHI